MHLPQPKNCARGKRRLNSRWHIISTFASHVTMATNVDQRKWRQILISVVFLSCVDENYNCCYSSVQSAYRTEWVYSAGMVWSTWVPQPWTGDRYYKYVVATFPKRRVGVWQLCLLSRERLGKVGREPDSSPFLHGPERNVGPNRGTNPSPVPNCRGRPMCRIAGQTRL